MTTFLPIMYIDFLTISAFAMVLTTIVVQVLATRRIQRDDSFSSDQRKAQLWLIWAVPLVGAAIVLSVLHDEPLRRTDRNSQQDS